MQRWSAAVAALSAFFVAAPALAQAPQEAVPTDFPPSRPARVPLGPPAPAPPLQEPTCKAPCPKFADRLATMGVRVSGALGSETTRAGVSWAGRLAQYANFSRANTHESLFWNLGGGGAGFEGAFGGSLAAGVKLPFDSAEGFVLRAGFEGYIIGDDTFYSSMFEIPQAQVGYQLLRRQTLLEIGGKVGAVVTGRLTDPAVLETRKFPIAPEWGAYGSMHFAPVRLDVAFTRYETHGDTIGTPIHLLDGALCGLARMVSLCVDARFERGDIPAFEGGDQSRPFQSLYGGVTLGVGYRPERVEADGAVIALEPIGIVENGRGEIGDDDWGDVVSTIRLVAPYGPESLEGLATFSHAELVYHFDRVAEARITTDARHPRNNTAWPKVGIFAQRGKNRPNRLGLTTVEIIRCEGASLVVRGLDAIDGTPVLDIKPVMREFMPRGPVAQPAWVSELMSGYWTSK